MVRQPGQATRWLGKCFRAVTALCVGVLLLLTPLAVLAQTPQGTAQPIRRLLPSEWDVPHPAGVAYSTGLGQLWLLEKNPLAPLPLTNPNLVVITPYEQLIGAVSLNFVLHNTINLAFADGGQRLFLLDQPTGQLAQVQIGAAGLLDPATLVQTDIRWFGLNNPQGMSVDAASSHLFILDSSPPRVIRLALTTTGLDDSQIQILNLTRVGLTNPRGLAVHPYNQHLYIGSPAEQQLAEVTQAGQLVARYDLTPLALVDQQGLVFAPSADLTDPPDTVHLLLADSNLPVSPTLPIASPTAVLPASVQTVGAGQLYLPVVTQLNNAAVQAATVTTGSLPAPFFGQIVEAALTCISCTQTITLTVSSAADDAEERASGGVVLDSSDLELTQDGTMQQTVGVRFAGVALPPGALVTNAYLEFETDEATHITTTLTLHGEAADAAVPFADLPYNISSRPRTAEAVNWTAVPAWNMVGEKQRTPNLAPLVQAIIARPGWQSGNPIALILSGTGQRIAKAYDGSPTGAPRLVIAYSRE